MQSLKIYSITLSKAAINLYRTSSENPSPISTLYLSPIINFSPVLFNDGFFMVCVGYKDTNLTGSFSLCLLHFQ